MGRWPHDEVVKAIRTVVFRDVTSGPIDPNDHHAHVSGPHLQEPALCKPSNSNSVNNVNDALKVYFYSRAGQVLLNVLLVVIVLLGTLSTPHSFFLPKWGCQTTNNFDHRVTLTPSHLANFGTPASLDKFASRTL